MEENTSNDNAELTPEQLDALQTFTSVTNQDVKDAIPLLQRSEWNVQIAITKFFDGERADPLEEARREAETVPAHARTSGVLLDGLSPSSVHHRGIRTSRGQPAGGTHGGRGQGHGGWRPPLLLAIIFSPFTIVYRIIASGFELLLDLWRGPPPPAPRPRVAPAVSHEQHARQTLRKEQESAYEKSLRQDREKTRLRREAEAQKSKEEQQAKVREAWRCWRASKLMPEPAANVKEVCRLSIRLPDGERVIRRFPADSEVEEIYAFVETRGVESKDVALLTKPDNYIHQYGFKLVQAIPRVVYDSNFGAIEGIGRSANLIVEYLEEDEDEDESSKE